jgi:hypothetical protein
MKGIIVVLTIHIAVVEKKSWSDNRAVLKMTVGLTI